MPHATREDAGLRSALRPYPGPQAFMQHPASSAGLIYSLHKQPLSIFCVPGSGLDAGENLEGKHKPPIRIKKIIALFKGVKQSTVKEWGGNRKICLEQKIFHGKDELALAMQSACAGVWWKRAQCMQARKAKGHYVSLSCLKVMLAWQSSQMKDGIGRRDRSWKALQSLDRVA